MRPRRRLPLQVFFATVVVLHAAFFYLPPRVAAALFWLPGRISTLIDRYLLHNPGTHGLGYFNPALDLAVLFTTSIALGSILAWLTYTAMDRR